MTTPRASVIVVAYNSAATLGDCLATLAPQVDALGGEVVVVDNASGDGSGDVAAAAGARVVRSEVNLGFAGGCNLGAAASDGEVVVLVNPDADLDPGALEVLVQTTQGPVGPVGGRAHHRDGTFDARCTMGRPRLRGAVAFALGLDTLWRGSSWFDPEHGPRHVGPSHEVVPVAAVSGAVMALGRPLWDRLGGLDEDFFVYGEDVDICMRAARAGAPPVVAAGAGYHHVGGMTIDGTPRRRILLYRGKVELYRRHLARPSSDLAVWCLQVGALVRGLPARLPLGIDPSRAAPWSELFRNRRQWRGGHTGRAT